MNDCLGFHFLFSHVCFWRNFRPETSHKYKVEIFAMDVGHQALLDGPMYAQSIAARERSVAEREAATAKREAEVMMQERLIAAKQRDLQKWEDALREKEKVFEEATQTVRAVCSYCGIGVCSRKGPCYTLCGRSNHHHSCASCHVAYKRGEKGSGRASQSCQTY